jgi:hypothetical protein
MEEIIGKSDGTTVVIKVVIGRGEVSEMSDDVVQLYRSTVGTWRESIMRQYTLTPARLRRVLTAFADIYASGDIIPELYMS